MMKTKKAIQKGLVFLLIATMLLPLIALLPVGAQQTGIVSAYAEQPFVLDGEIGADEVWAQATAIPLNVWKSAENDAQGVAATGNDIPSLKIANTDEYLYYYLESAHFTNSAYNGGALMRLQMAVGAEETFYSDIIWTDKEQNRAYDGGYCFVNLVTPDNPDTTDVDERVPYDGGTVEGKIALPMSVKKALAEGDVTVTFSVYLRNAMQADNTANGDGTNGFTTQGGYATGDFTKGEKIILKKTDRVWPTVEITSIEENAGIVTVRGTTENLGERKVEIIVNSDLNMRYVADNDADGNWECQFKVPYNGQYAIEASVRDYSDFNQIRTTTADNNYFMLEDADVWGATVTKHTDGLYYMLFATWDKHDGFGTDWYHYSEISYAVSTTLEGPYVYRGKALDAAYTNTTHDAPIQWSFSGTMATLDVFHNPNVMHSEDGKYYLYFMGTSRDDMSKSHSRQRTGVAYADSPAGPWTIVDAPVFDVGDDWVTNMTSNPSVTEIRQSDGSYLYYAVHKASGTYDGQSLTATAVATSTSPVGPFTRADAPIMRDPEVGFSVEDCYVWVHNGKYYALAKDMTQGNWTGVTGAYSYALFESADGVNWGLSEHNLAFKNEILWESGTQAVDFYERSQLYVEKGIPFMIFNASTVNGKSPYANNKPYNVRTPLLGVEISADTQVLRVSDLAGKTLDTTALQELLKASTSLTRFHFQAEDYKVFSSAVFAAEVLLTQSNVDQATVDFVADALEQVINKKITSTAPTFNIAQGKPIEASSVYTNLAGYTADKAVDGNADTRWSATNDVTGSVTLEIDLQGSYELHAFSLEIGSDWATRIQNYRWEYYNGTTWLSVDGTNTALSGTFDSLVIAEKLRLVITSYTAAPTINEIRVLGTAVKGNIALHKDIAVNSNYGGSYGPEMAVDGNADTRWSATNGVTGDVTLDINLADRYLLESFALEIGSDWAARIEEYRWEYFDGAVWRCYPGTFTTLSASFDGYIVAEQLRLVITKYNNTPTINEIKINGALENTNVAVGKTTTASSVYTNLSGYTADKATDGNTHPDNRWSAANDVTGDVTIEVDLAGGFTLDSYDMIIHNSEWAARIQNYRWEYFDGTEWKSLSFTKNGLEGVFTEKVVAQRLRLFITEYTAAPTINELQVFGTYASGNVAQGKDVVASNVYTFMGGYEADKAVDGNTGTRWSTANEVTGDVTFEIDLAGRYFPQSFNLVITDAGQAARIQSYKWEYFDGTEWKALVATIDGLSGTFTDRVAAHKVRLVITGYSGAPTINEIQVIGSPAVTEHTPVTPKHSVAVIGINAVSKGEVWFTEGKDYTRTLTAVEGYALPDTVTVKRGGTTVLVADTDYTYDKATGVLTVKGSSATDYLTVSVSAERIITVTYDPNGGSGTMAPTVAQGEQYALTLPACTFTAPHGKVFSTWSVNGEEKAAGEVVQITESTTVLALWVDDTTTKFDVVINSGTANVAGASATQATQKTLVNIVAAAAPAGQVFDKWVVVSGNVTLADATQANTSFEMPFEDVEITATYKHVCSYDTLKYDEANHWMECACGEKNGITPHEANADDNNCTTAVTCKHCPTVLTPAKDDHEANADDNNCTTAVTCKHCPTVLTPTKDAHTPNADDNDCTTAIVCSVCGTVTTEGATAHTGGAATCTARASCDACGKEYGDMLPHVPSSTWKSDTDQHWNECACGEKANVAIHADANADGKCDVCVYVLSVSGSDTSPDTSNSDAGSTGASTNDADGLATGAIIAIVIGCVAAVGIGGFCLYWFVIRKKKL